MKQEGFNCIVPRKALKYRQMVEPSLAMLHLHRDNKEWEPIMGDLATDVENVNS